MSKETNGISAGGGPARSPARPPSGERQPRPERVFGPTSATRVVVIGSGVIGASIAYHLAQRQGVAVVSLAPNREPTAPTASWGSAGGVRRQGRDAREAGLAVRAASRWPTLSDELGGDTGFLQLGHLRVAENDGEASLARHELAEEQARGVSAEWLDQEEVRRLVPGLSTRAVGGVYSAEDGHADPRATTRSYLAAARRLGSTFVEGRVLRLEAAKSGALKAVSTAGALEADVIVLAAGVWTGPLLRTTGVDLEIVPLSTQMLLSDPVPFRRMPTVSAVGRNISLKQLASGRFFVGGGFRSRFSRRDSRCTVLRSSVSAAWKNTGAVFPPLLERQIVESWGAVDGATSDRVPCIGPIPGSPRLYVAAGFSGHGFQLSPAVGEAVADMIADKAPGWAGLADLAVSRLWPTAALREPGSSGVAAIRAGSSVPVG